jgi:hypothetical protein
VSAQRPRFLFSKRSATTIYNRRSLALVAVKRPSLAAAVAGVDLTRSAVAALAVETVVKIVHMPEPRR